MVKAKPRSALGSGDVWLTLAMLGLTLVNAIQAKQDIEGSSSLVNLVPWGVAYLVAGMRLLTMRRQLSTLLAGSAPLLFFVGLAMLSTLWSVDSGTTFRDSVALAGTTIVAAFIVARFRLSEFLSILMLFFAGTAAFSLMLVFLAPGRGRMFWGSGPWMGIYQEKNALGAAMAIGILVFGIRLLQRHGARKPLAFAGFTLCAVLLAGSNSITAFLDCLAVVAIGLVALVCVSPNYGGIARIVLLVGGAVLAGLFTLTGFNPGGLIESLGRSESLSGRTDFWPILGQAINARPILGYGYGAFFHSAISQDYLSYYVIEAGGWSPSHAHNSFLQACLDTGYVGLAALIVLILTSLFRAVRLLVREPNVVSLWPLLVLSYLVLGSYTEMYLGSFNTLEWIFFVTASLYPIRAELTESIQPVRHWTGSAPGRTARSL